MKPAEITATAPQRPDLTVVGPVPASAKPKKPDKPGRRQTAGAGSVDPYAQPASAWQRFLQRIERRISKLSVRNNFWHRVCSWRWLPLAFHSGIKVHKGDIGTFAALLPFRRFNRNWYNAMAGGALLGNAEVAGGMFLFQKCGGDYTVVCKHLEYDFLRPCVGPAVYRIEPRDDIEELMKTGDEFNICVDMYIVQMVQTKQKSRERRVGRCTATFHITPKAMHRVRKERRKQRA